MSSPDSAREGSQGEYSLDEEGQLTQEDTLIDRGVEDTLDEGYSPPERPLGLDAYGTTGAEQREGESLDQRLAEEVPDISDEGGSPEFRDFREVGASRSGRLVADDQGSGEDTEKDMVAEDIGIDGGAASAEEAAVHVVEDD
ncbi:MAG: hypothetical protein GX610_12865 [Rhodococcus sp.]|nr:hypothetical protein [Rhodococcus sp. (in: high G+C Gram-positive bacteria)]